MSVIAASTADAESSVAWFATECRRNGVRIERHIESAERAGDPEMAEFFRRAQREADQLAHQGR